jgi:4,5:9,10-diseco-3-hydroxy-5,9,17-trioxoandrosta-1(10),2-diene-4-oate hydrolase
MSSFLLVAALAVVQADAPAAASAVEPQVLRIATAAADTLAVTIEGDGKPIVFVPGLLGSSYGFRNVTEPLNARGYRTVVIEPLGTGSSTRPDDGDYSLTAQADRIGQVLDSLGLSESLLVCHAIGGSICMRLAYRRPELVGGIVSINGGPAERAGTPGLRRALSLVSFLKIFTGNGFVRGKLRDGLRDSSGDPSWVTDEVLRGYTQAFGDDLDPVLDGLKEIASAPEPEQLVPNLGRIDCPVVLVVGDAEDADGMPDDEVALLREHLPAVEVDTVEGAGQYVHEEQPDAVVAAILVIMETATSLR